VSRLCIHQLESARVLREQYVGPWLPEPVSAEAIADPLDASELHESLSMAFLLLVERLTESRPCSIQHPSSTTLVA
jgi:RNA polymerase sigma-70 factor (ECF subfamily)